MPKQPESSRPLRAIRSALKLFLSTSTQGAVCLSVGGLLTYAGLLIGTPIYQAPMMILAGMAIPLWPMHIYFSPDRELNRKLARWDKWEKAGTITKPTCNRWKRAEIQSYEARHVGRGGGEKPETAGLSGVIREE